MLVCVFVFINSNGMSMVDWEEMGCHSQSEPLPIYHAHCLSLIDVLQSTTHCENCQTDLISVLKLWVSLGEVLTRNLMFSFGQLGIAQITKSIFQQCFYKKLTSWQSCYVLQPAFGSTQKLTSSIFRLGFILLHFYTIFLWNEISGLVEISFGPILTWKTSVCWVSMGR